MGASAQKNRHEWELKKMIFNEKIHYEILEIQNRLSDMTQEYSGFLRENAESGKEMRDVIRIADMVYEANLDWMRKVNKIFTEMINSKRSKGKK